MGTAQKKAHLSPTERKKIEREYATGEYSYRSLASKYGVSYATIYRIVQNKNKADASSEKKSEPSAEPIVMDPIAFRRAKIAEIAGDIMATRIRGSVQVLPALHRLHISTHDELIAMKEEREALDGIVRPDELLNTIAIAVAGLPPLLRDQLQDMINSDFSNIEFIPNDS